MKPIPKIIGGIVDAVRTDYDPVNGLAPYYMHGHPMEIVNILSQKTKNETLKFQKYPLIALFQDFDESITGQRRDATLNIVICTETSPQFEATERYENTFKPVLNPLFDFFWKHLKRSYYLNVLPDSITFEKTDRVYWGRQGLYGSEGNIFDDHIDAIEISNLSLSLITGCQY
jgi:hypothetical protein